MADETSSTDTTDTGETTVDVETSDAPSDLGDAGKKALEAERSRAKEAEKRARAAERALDAERAKGLTETERAIAEAKEAGRAEATLDAGKRLVRAEIRAHGSEKGLDVAALLEDLDLSRFVGDDGEPDEAAIAKAVGRWAAIAPQSARPRGDIGQGSRGRPAPTDPAEVFAQIMRGEHT